jgi:hypothetical protein
MKRIVVGALLAAFSALAFAQTPPPPPARVRGTVEKLENLVLTVKSRDGSTVNIKLAETYTVVGVSRATLEDVGKGKFIGVASLGQKDGALVALEVHIFPEAMRGTGEGHYPWDLKPESLMTNANVADVVSVGKDRMLTVQYKGGEKKILVPVDAEIVSFAPADRAELKAGARIFCVAQRAPDGSLSAGRVNVGLNGITPPM